MLSLSEIAKNCTSKPFNRGEALANMPHAVFDRTCTKLDDACEITGSVMAAKGLSKSFTATIVTDEEYESILEAECTCPASSRRGFLCKHCVALAFAFKAHPETFRGYQEGDELDTARPIKEMIAEAQAARTQSIPEHTIDLAVTIKRDFDTWSVSLKIKSPEVTYTITDLDQFISAWINGSYAEYGKKLKFVHDRALFTAPAARIADFLARAHGVRKELSNANPRMMPTRSKRELYLTEDEIASLLRLLSDTTFGFIDTALNRDESALFLSDEDPTLPLELYPDEHGGIYMGCNPNLIVVQGAAGLFLIDDASVRVASSKLEKMSSFIKHVYLADTPTYVSKEDLPAFARLILPALGEVMELHYPQELEMLFATDVTISFYLDKTGRGKNEQIELEVRATYRDCTITLLSASSPAVPAPDATTEVPLPIYRDEDREHEAIERAFAYVNADMCLSLVETDRVGALIFHGLSAFAELGRVYTTPAFDRLLNAPDPHLHLGVSLVGDLIELDVRSDDLSPEELERVFASLRQKKHYHLLKNGAVMSLASHELHELDRLMSDLHVKPSELADGSYTLPTYQSVYLDEVFPEADKSESYRHLLDRIHNPFASTPDLPASLLLTMRRYQQDGFTWLHNLTEMNMGGILADEMGLGKSLQIISVLLSYQERGLLTKPALIVCPASVVYNWVDEIRKSTSSLNMCVLDGNKYERRALLDSLAADVLICSYDMVRIECETLEKIPFGFIILDEAHYIKNHGTKTTRAVKRLDAEHRFALSGTPIENRLSELWSLFDFLMPGFLGSYAHFRQRFELDIIGGDETVAEELSTLIRPFVLRRLKATVLSELPEKTETVIHIPLETQQKKLYLASEQKLREDLNRQKKTSASRAARRAHGSINRNRIEILSEIMKLRQIALDPALVFENYERKAAKEDAIMDIVTQAIETKRKVLIFSQFTSYLSVLEQRLHDEGITPYVLTGSTPKAKRIELVDAFNTNDVPVFLISLKAGGVGLNLTSAEVVIHADPWWNASVMNQATDRAHRIGQKNRVSVYKLIAKDTIEERIAQLQYKKAQLSEGVIGENDRASLEGLTMAEITALLTP